MASGVVYPISVLSSIFFMMPCPSIILRISGLARHQHLDHADAYGFAVLVDALPFEFDDAAIGARRFLAVRNDDSDADRIADESRLGKAEIHIQQIGRGA